MRSLSSKEESFVKLMTTGPEYEQRGFELLLKRSNFEEFFDALAAAGLFDPARNPAPVPGDQPGYYRVPYWEPLRYLEAVAKLSGERDDVTLAEKVMSVVRRVSRWREEEDGSVRDSHHTYHTFAKILGLVPTRVVTPEDIDLMPAWLEAKFDRGSVAFALAGGALQRFIDSSCAGDWMKACRIIEHCTVLRWVDDAKWGGNQKTPVAAVDNYSLKKLINATASKLGEKAGRDASAIFLARLRETYSQDIGRQSSWILRPAVEEHPQNHSWRGPENYFVEGLRDVLIAWSDEDGPAVQVFIAELLRDEAEIVRRVAIHVVNVRFDTFHDIFARVLDTALFSSGHLHELYNLLRQHFAEFRQEEKSTTLCAVRNLPVPAISEDPNGALRYRQKQWLSAIVGKGSQETDEWFRELSNDPELGALSPHPDFLSYMESRWGFGPTPYPAPELVAFATDGSLVEKLNAFTEPHSWDGPSTRSLVDALVEAIGAKPEVFLRALPKFHKANRPYQYGMINGFKKLWDSASDTMTPIDWSDAWPRLMEFFKELIEAEEFWTENVAETEPLTPTRDWIPPAVSEFLRAGVRTDAKAYTPDLLPRGWSLIKILVERSDAQTDPAESDAMNKAINSSKGKSIEALMDHALRSCRISDQTTGSHTAVWAEMVSVFDKEIAKCRNANYEFSTLAGAYVAHIHYMDRKWCEENFERIFPVDAPANCRSALDGMAFAPASERIYELLVERGIMEWALHHALKGSHARENMLQRMAIAYLWGKDSLDSPRFSYIFEGHIDDLEDVAKYFWAVSNQGLSDEQKERIIEFWDRCVAQTCSAAPAPAKLLTTLSLLSCYLTHIGEREQRLLAAVAPHVSVDHNVQEFLRELDRLVDINPVEVCRLLDKMLDTNRPTYDYDDKLKRLLAKLAERSDTRLDALRYAERLAGQLPGMVELYRQLTAVSV